MTVAPMGWHKGLSRGYIKKISPRRKGKPVLRHHPQGCWKEKISESWKLKFCQKGQNLKEGRVWEPPTCARPNPTPNTIPASPAGSTRWLCCIYLHLISFTLKLIIKIIVKLLNNYKNVRFKMARRGEFAYNLLPISPHCWHLTLPGSICQN